MATYLGHQEDSNGNILLPTPHSMAAQVELGTTASQAYTTGTYLVFNNRLCKATTAIASGDTLAVGTNLVQCSIGSELSLHLQANNNEFYFDYHDGKYGYNTDPQRDAATFISFKLAPIDLGVGTTFNVSQYQGYEQFTVDNFIVYVVSVSGSASAWNNYGDEGSASVNYSATMTKSYNSSTGVLTISGLSASGSQTTRNGAATLHTASGNCSVTVGVMLVS